VYPITEFAFSGNVVAPGASGQFAYMPVSLYLYNGNTIVDSYSQNIFIPVTNPGNWSYTVIPDWTAFYISNYSGSNITMQAFVSATTNSQFVYVQNARFQRSTLVLQSLKR
jgi:hypothetical protein